MNLLRLFREISYAKKIAKLPQANRSDNYRIQILVGCYIFIATMIKHVK